MVRIRRVVLAAAVLAIVPIAAAQAAPITHNVEIGAGETKIWAGTPRTGVNPNYNGLHAALNDVFGPARTCTTNPQNLCEYTLVKASNPVPADDADGKLRKPMSVTLNNFSPESPVSDFALTVYTTDSTGSTRGQELATSDNTDVPDPDETVTVTVQTTTAEPTQYFLVEVAYFIGANSGYRGTVQF